MQQGFIVEIVNCTSEAQEVKLFVGSLPDGVLVNTMDKVYNFDTLQQIAKKNGFVCNSITTGFEPGLQIEIVSKDKTQKITLNGRFESSEIRINGADEFILVTSPPNANFYIRLGMI